MLSRGPPPAPPTCRERGRAAAPHRRRRSRRAARARRAGRSRVPMGALPAIAPAEPSRPLSPGGAAAARFPVAACRSPRGLQRFEPLHPAASGRPLRFDSTLRQTRSATPVRLWLPRGLRPPGEARRVVSATRRVLFLWNSLCPRMVGKVVGDFIVRRASAGPVIAWSPRRSRGRARLSSHGPRRSFRRLRL